jgi:hypothetical protein
MSEPVAWHYPGGSPDQCTTNKEYAEMDPAWTPLYTHPAKTEDEGKVCARCGAIAYDPVITQTAKTLTDEEITDLFRASSDHIEFARAILRKAQEK